MARRRSGIVYKTDAASDPTVKIVGTFPADSHPPIIYPAAVTKEGADSARRGLPQVPVRGPAAKTAFEKQGFTPDRSGRILIPGRCGASRRMS